ncbi:MAG: hypothetical protein M0P69_05950 [Bacteroidales bacterium]|nr:hypothetical protein [Bacteroidales bacterium]
MSNPTYKDTGSPLTRAAEECREVTRIACKIDRFGWWSYHPEDQKKVPSMELIRREMDDVIEAFEGLERHIMGIRAAVISGRLLRGWRWIKCNCTH